MGATWEASGLEMRSIHNCDYITVKAKTYDLMPLIVKTLFEKSKDFALRVVACDMGTRLHSASANNGTRWPPAKTVMAQPILLQSIFAYTISAYFME